MKKLLFILWILSMSSSYAQTWEWASNINSGAQSYGTSVNTDKQGDIYITGHSQYFTGGSGSYYYELLWKLDSLGSLLWTDTLKIGSTHSVMDIQGNIFIAGGNKIAKYNTSGQKIWIISI